MIRAARINLAGALPALHDLFADAKPHGAAQAAVAAQVPTPHVVAILRHMERRGDLQRVERRGRWRSADTGLVWIAAR